jgi:hypothetical protein
MLKLIVAIAAAFCFTWMAVTWAPTLSHHVFTASGINFTWATLLFMVCLVATMRVSHGK